MIVDRVGSVTCCQPAVAVGLQSVTLLPASTAPFFSLKPSCSLESLVPGTPGEGAKSYEYRMHMPVAKLIPPSAAPPTVCVNSLAAARAGVFASLALAE